MTLARSRLLLAAALGTASTWGPTPACAEPPAGVCFVGEPAGAAPRERLDPSRRGRSSVPLPLAPTLRWRRELDGGLAAPPLVDREGGIVALLASGVLVRTQANGTAAWSRRLPCVPATVAPVLTTDGTVGVLCQQGALVHVTLGNEVLPLRPLGDEAFLTTTTPLVHEDGSITFALDRQLVRLGADGSREALRLPTTGHPVGAVLPFDGDALVTLDDGEVWRWRRPRGLESLGSFGGALERGGVVFGSRALAAVVDGRLAVLDPVTRAVRTLLADELHGRVDGLPALDLRGRGWALSTAGELLEFGSSGDLVRRIELSPASAGTNAAGRPSAGDDEAPGASLLVDAHGVVAFARSPGATGVVGTDGVVRRFGASACARPTALVPAGAGRLLLACQDGVLSLWGDT